MAIKLAFAVAIIIAAVVTRFNMRRALGLE
jgi:hypothetical protein